MISLFHVNISYLTVFNFTLIFLLRFDPKSNRWTKVASMSTRRLGVGVAVLGGYLYAVGGSDGTCPLNTGMFVMKNILNYNVYLKKKSKTKKITYNKTNFGLCISLILKMWWP